MKKNHFTSALLALALITTAVPLQAQDEIMQEQIEEVMQQPTQEITPEEAPLKKQPWIKRQFNESIDRFKKCWRKECSTPEIRKAVRDIIIAITTITALYLSGRVIQKVKTSTEKEEPKIGDFYVDPSTKQVFKITYKNPFYITVTLLRYGDTLSISHDKWKLSNFEKVSLPNIGDKYESEDGTFEVAKIDVEQQDPFIYMKRRPQDTVGYYVPFSSIFQHDYKKIP
jgi:hypothetical protein